MVQFVHHRTLRIHHLLIWPFSSVSYSTEERRNLGPRQCRPLLTTKIFPSPVEFISLINHESPWLVWLNGLSAHLWTKGSRAPFPVREHTWVASQVPSRGRARGTHTMMFLSLPSSLSKYIHIFFKRKKKTMNPCTFLLPSLYLILAVLYFGSNLFFTLQSESLSKTKSWSCQVGIKHFNDLFFQDKDKNII